MRGDMLFRLARPALFALDPEVAHRATIRALAAWSALGAPAGGGPAPRRPVTIAGLDFPNPVGLAAGFDKDGEAIDGAFALGFGFVEIGTLTPRPQPGNPRPRLFRLVEDEAVINRMGFNNGGIDAALGRVARARRAGVLGINVGANKESDDRIGDYATGVARVAPAADYVTINISSPNTPGLRDLQSQPALGELLARCDAARHLGDGTRRPLFLKIAPDLDRAAIDVIVRAACDHHVDALIVGNTTLSRPPLDSPEAGETGGLSGQPLAPLARTVLAQVHAASGGAIALIAAGGIDSPAEARARLDAGASLVQLYSALVFHGPGLARYIATHL
ncbi:quinone-dependent dihydroorotate dehydrogenase [Sphingomonas sp. CCH5-A5]|jgi:dihydroorotate dehydrogenase|uniref:quinone-dependent dihydroorotate dehydrogenase n=2 Tax=Sphingomonas TaxID=13687 RepID=UPI000A852683|nr:quinone-dependent dihydroorotate dehydrogenase [Sphingomonas sp. CCH5-A5]